MNFPKRGEVYWGPDKKKTKSLLDVSNNLGNQYSSDIVVIPGTTQNINTVYPTEVLVNEDFSNLTKFQTDSIFTIAKAELGEKITSLSADIMKDINRALRLELNLD